MDEKMRNGCDNNETLDNDASGPHCYQMSTWNKYPNTGQRCFQSTLVPVTKWALETSTLARILQGNCEGSRWRDFQKVAGNSTAFVFSFILSSLTQCSIPWGHISPFPPRMSWCTEVPKGLVLGLWPYLGVTGSLVPPAPSRRALPFRHCCRGPPSQDQHMLPANSKEGENMRLKLDLRSPPLESAQRSGHGYFSDGQKNSKHMHILDAILSTIMVPEPHVGSTLPHKKLKTWLGLELRAVRSWLYSNSRKEKQNLPNIKRAYIKILQMKPTSFSSRQNNEVES